jgi:dTDP-4-amino-4,6-dideoxygalactose transaminase
VNPFRRQLPVWSPLSLSAIGAAVRPPAGALADLAAELRAQYGATDVVLTASGTVALTLAIRNAAPSGRAPRVALPAYGCYDLATAADGADASVRLYDLDPATLAPDPTSFRAALAAGVDAVVLVHLYGLPVSPKFVAEARAAGVLVIDDAAQGQGGSLAGVPLGALGDVGVLSFGRGKGRTGGGGGALLATSPAGARIVGAVGQLPQPSSSGRLVAGLVAQWVFARPGLYALPASIPWLRLGDTLYHPPPKLEAMTPASAAVLRSSRAAIEAENEARRQSGDRWLGTLAGVDSLERVKVEAGGRPGWPRSPGVAGPRIRDRLSSAEARALGVMPGYPTPLQSLAGFERRLAGSLPAPGAAYLSTRLFTYPTHSLLSGADRERITALAAGL